MNNLQEGILFHDNSLAVAGNSNFITKWRGYFETLSQVVSRDKVHLTFIDK